MRGPLADARADVHVPDQGGVAVQEHALPRNAHVVEHRDRVHLVEARAERMIFDRPRPAEGFAADDLEAGRGDGNHEHDGVGRLGLGQRGRKRPRQNLVGERRRGRDHLSPAHDQSLGGLVHDAEALVRVVLLGAVLRAVHLRVDERMRHEQVALAAVFVIRQHAVAAGRIPLREIVGLGRPRRQHGVQEVGAAAQHAARRVRPRFGHLPPAGQVLTGARNQEGAAHRVAAGRRRVAERVLMGGRVLHVVQRRNAFHRGPKRGMGRHVGHALVAEPDLAAIPQPSNVLRSGACAHAVPKWKRDLCRFGGPLYGVPGERASRTREAARAVC